MQVVRTSCCAADLICEPKGFRRLLTRFQRGLCVGCLLSERLLDPEICGTTGFVTCSPKDFNMKSAAVGNPQGASQGQTIDAPISVMFPALKRTLNPAKSTRPEFEVLVSKENGRVENSFISRVVSLPEICLLWLPLLPHSPLSWQQRERERDQVSRPGPEMQHHSQQPRVLVGRLRGSQEEEGPPLRVSSNSGKAFH